MTGYISSWLLQVYLLLLLVRPLDPSSQPEQGLHAQELWDMDSDQTPKLNVNMALLAGTCFLVEMLIASIALRYYRRRKLRRGQKVEKHLSPPAPAGEGRCREHTCPTKLIQLLRHNRAMLQMCLEHCSQERSKAKRGAARTLWKKRRFRASPQH